MNSNLYETSRVFNTTWEYISAYPLGSYIFCEQDAKDGLISFKFT